MTGIILAMLLLASRTFPVSLISTPPGTTGELNPPNVSSSQPESRQIDSTDTRIVLNLNIRLFHDELKYKLTMKSLHVFHQCVCNDNSTSCGVKSDEEEIKSGASNFENVHNRFVCADLRDDAFVCRRHVEGCATQCALALIAVGGNCHKDGVAVIFKGAERISLTVKSENVLDLFDCRNDACVIVNDQATTTPTRLHSTSDTTTVTTVSHSTTDDSKTKTIIIAVCVVVGGVVVFVVVAFVVLRYKRTYAYTLASVCAQLGGEENAPDGTGNTIAMDRMDQNN